MKNRKRRILHGLDITKHSFNFFKSIMLIMCKSQGRRGFDIGYMLTFARPISPRESIEVDVYERDGKIYFSVRERKHDE